MKINLSLVSLFLATTQIFGVRGIEWAPQISSEVSEWPAIKFPKYFSAADSMRDFSQELFLKLSNVEKGNFVFSPVSLHMTLTILALGAPFRSKTRNELVSKFSYLYFYILACE